MRYPKHLPANGVIAFIAPSFGCAVEPYYTAFLNGIDKLTSLGYQTVTGPNAFSGSGVGISSTPEACGAEVNDFLTRSAVGAVISCGGGELMCTVLDEIDFPELKKSPPKWFMGFSDNTNLSFLLPTLCDTAAIYGPCAPAFGMEPWHPSVRDALQLLSGTAEQIRSYGSWQLEGGKDAEHPCLPYQTDHPTALRKYPEGCGEIHIKGRLLGGCLDILCTLSGTCYDKTPEFIERYREDGILWFLESCDLNVFDIQRALWQLEHSGWFRFTRGFLIGRPLCFGQELMGLNQYDAVTNVLGKYGVPIIMDADLGHLPPSMPLITGAVCDLRCRGDEVSLRFQKI